MRGRIERELAGEARGRYHPKLGFGGLVDVEFAVQWLQMRHGATGAIRLRRTRDALRALRETGFVRAADADVLDDGYQLFRSVEQAMRLLDDKREPTLARGGRMAAYVARQLGIQDRDGHPAHRVLIDTWERRAEEVRSVFERVIGPVSTRPWWQDHPLHEDAQ
jgi:glutamate-ammonia-ligase adenylyltransferase